MKNRPAVFFDRDGTLMEEVEYCNDPARVRAFEGAAAGLANLRKSGWLNVIITNQSGIASGKISPDQYRAVEAELNRQMGGLVDAVYFCADSSAAPTPRRKPGTGMLEEAARDLGIDLSKSWMVGDKDIDIECGRSAGCHTILVRTGYGSLHAGCKPEHIVDDIGGAIAFILQNPLQS
ncbi:MAG: D-glycero-alpha-D-manno-heptose-1,7-bisphosphate 7-phosphatase [Terrimicrobiaceae bacterium]